VDNDEMTVDKHADALSQFRLFFTGQQGSPECYKIVDPLSPGAAVRTCERRGFGVARVRVHPHFRADSTLNVDSDVALVELDEEPAGDRAFYLPAEVNREALLEHREQDVTIAGFGYTGLPGDRPGDNVEVGWQPMILPPRAQHLSWDASRRGLSTSCNFDSGAPIAHGFLQGYEDEEHVLIGTVVGLIQAAAAVRHPTSDNDGSSAITTGCRGGEGVATYLLSPHIKEWLCSDPNLQRRAFQYCTK
jgi:hypothetical protein